MKKAVLLLGLLLIAGCTNLTGDNTSTETKITASQGVGVLEFKPVVNEMLVSTYNYVLLSIRNNAAGNNAKNIKASLENVQPFTIYECNLERNPSEERQEICNQFFDDFQVPYKSHKINEMIPDEEIQFFWNIKSPSNSKLAGLSYTHTMYYTLEYDYKSTVTQTIIGISQDEYLEQSEDGPVTLSGQTISSPGEIKLESKTQQPLIYSEGLGNLDFTLEFDVKNTGSGVPKPGTNIIIAVEKDALTSIGSTASDYAWESYDSTTELSQNFDNAFPYIDFNELGPEGGSIRQNLMLTSVSANQLSVSDYSLVLPMTFDVSGIFEPQKILTITAYVSYTYLKEGSTTISVYPKQ